MSHQERKRRREQLWLLQQGKCHWCQCVMLHWNDLRNDPGKRKRFSYLLQSNTNKLKQPPRNLATIDHLRDRWHPQRQEPNGGHEQRWVLACWACNNARGNASTREQPLEELRRKSGRGKAESKTDLRALPEASQRHHDARASPGSQ